MRAFATAALAIAMASGCADAFHVDEETVRAPLLVKCAEPSRGVKTGGETVRIYFQSSGFDGTRTVGAGIGGEPAPVVSIGGPFCGWLWYAEVSTPVFDCTGPADVSISAAGIGEAVLLDGFFVYPAGQVLVSSGFPSPRPSPRAAFACDVNLDGLPDIGLLYSGAWQDRIGVLLNGGSSSFPQSSEMTAPSQAVQAGCGDFDGDGRPDVLALCPGSAAAVLFLGDGAGGFAAAGGFAVSAQAALAAVGDFDGDGLDDAAAIGPGGADVFLARPGGSFSACGNRALGPGPAACAAFDMNSDGRVDLLVADPAEQSLSVLLGDPVQGLLPRNTTALPFPPGFAAAGRIDMDPRPDAALACPGGTAVLLQNQDGTFGIAAALPFAAPSSIAIADFNGDGTGDFTVADGFVFSVRMGNGGGGIKPALNLDLAFPGALSGLALADFDGDGFMDAALAEPAADKVHVCRGVPQ